VYKSNKTNNKNQPKPKKIITHSQQTSPKKQPERLYEISVWATPYDCTKLAYGQRPTIARN